MTPVVDRNNQNSAINSIFISFEKYTKKKSSLTTTTQRAKPPGGEMDQRPKIFHPFFLLLSKLLFSKPPKRFQMMISASSKTLSVSQRSNCNVQVQCFDRHYKRTMQSISKYACFQWKPVISSQPAMHDTCMCIVLPYCSFPYKLNSENIPTFDNSLLDFRYRSSLTNNAKSE